MRPAPTSKLRKVWNLFHWWFGRGVMLAGLGNFFFGVWMVNGNAPAYFIVPAAIILMWCGIAFVKVRHAQAVLLDQQNLSAFLGHSDCRSKS